ncbi:MAG: amidase, partial [Burkholderiaceae bacterium]|nr:amidase [Burkholderiaceae bacterium]
MSELANYVSTTMPGGYSEMGGQGINPYGEEFSPRGSSSGSAIAVAAGLCDAALGTETSGSIVLPAMACGVWGMKPTVGLLSRGGIVPLSHTFDTPGVMARDVQTIVDLMNIMQETDPDDPITERAHEIHLDVMGYKHGSPVRVAVMVFENRPLQFEQVQLLEALKTKLATVNIEVVTVEVQPVEFDYKAITSIDFQNDINRFFRRYSDGNHVGDVESLVAYYRAREEHHPYGFDRLTDALEYDADAAGYEDLVHETLTRANLAIEDALARAQAQALIAFDFVNWWAIAQAPYMAVPWGVDMNGKPVGFTLGCRAMEDGKVIALSKRIEKALAQ